MMNRTTHWGKRKKRTLWLGLLPLLAVAILVAPRASLAQDKSLIWDRYDTNITVEENGDMLVEEIQEIVFTSGTFRFGFAEIPLDRIGQITDVSVSEMIDGEEGAYSPSSTGEYGFTSRRIGNNQEIKWYFPPTKNSRHTFVLRYRVKGALRMYDDYDQVWWKAIPAEHGFPIRSATVTVTPPRTFPLEQLEIDSYGAKVDNTSYTDRGDVVFRASDIPANKELEVSVKFPSGVVQGVAPVWQEADDLSQGWGPLVSLLSWALGLFLLVGGLVGVYLLWQWRGRDREPGVVPEYLTEPPSSLPAGLVGTLIDEHADFKDIIASIFDLAQRGAIRVESKVIDTRYFSASRHDFIFYPENLKLAIYPHEERLLRHMFGNYEEAGSGGTKERRLNYLRQTFYQVVPDLKEDLYQQVVKEGLFPANPSETRKRWLWLAIGGIAAALVGAVVLIGALGHLSGAVVLPALGLVPGLATLAIVSGHMPKKTSAGAEEAAKWLAFKNHLENLEAQGELEAVKGKFQAYLPYAVAFGLDRRLIHKFTKVDAPAPSWWGPVPLPDLAEVLPDSVPDIPIPRGSSSIPSPRLPGRLSGGGRGGAPTLTGMSDGLGASLAGMSEGLGGLLNSTASALPKPAAPPSSIFSDIDGWELAGKIALLALEIGFAAATGGGGGGGGSRGFG